MVRITGVFMPGDSRGSAQPIYASIDLRLGKALLQCQLRPVGRVEPCGSFKEPFVEEDLMEDAFNFYMGEGDKDNMIQLGVDRWGGFIVIPL